MKLSLPEPSSSSSWSPPTARELIPGDIYSSGWPSPHPHRGSFNGAGGSGPTGVEISRGSSCEAQRVIATVAVVGAVARLHALRACMCDPLMLCGVRLCGPSRCGSYLAMSCTTCGFCSPMYSPLQQSCPPVWVGHANAQNACRVARKARAVLRLSLTRVVLPYACRIKNSSTLAVRVCRKFIFMS